MEIWYLWTWRPSLVQSRHIESKSQVWLLISCQVAEDVCVCACVCYVNYMFIIVYYYYYKIR